MPGDDVTPAIVTVSTGTVAQLEWGARTGRIGIYFRVLEPGWLRAGDPLIVKDIPDHGITAADVHRVLNVDRRDRVGITRLLEHSSLLPDGWAATLRKRLAPGVEAEDQSPRLYGV